MSLPMLFVLIAGASGLMGFYRLLAGPTATDRVVGLDILFAVAIILSLVASWVSGRTVYLDVAIGLALVGCVATLSWARLIQPDAEGGGQVKSLGGAQVRSQDDGRFGNPGGAQGSGQCGDQVGSQGGSLVSSQVSSQARGQVDSRGERRGDSQVPEGRP